MAKKSKRDHPSSEEVLKNSLCAGEIRLLQAAGYDISGTSPKDQTRRVQEAIVYLRTKGRPTFVRKFKPGPLPQPEDISVSGRLSGPSETGCNHSSPRQGHGHY